jgi:mRNA interferase RelE/StbE
VSESPDHDAYAIRFQASARRAIAHDLPESVAAAVLEFCSAALASEPHRVGKPLFGPLDGCHGARRGSYRVVYRIDDKKRTVHVLDVAHRRDAYRPHRTDGGDAATQRSMAPHWPRRT